jgi:hypothetical protein
MGVRINVPGAVPPGTSTANDLRSHQFVLQEAISAYSHEAYTNAKKITSTGLVGDNPLIDTSTETYIGQTRWFKPMNPTINVASLTDPTAGTLSTYGSEYLKYVKTLRTYGGEKINLQHVITQMDGLSKIGRDFGEHRAQDEHNALMSVLKGVAISEALVGVSSGSGQAGLGGQTWENDPASKRHGFYVDLGSSGKLVGAQTTTSSGAQRAEGFLTAFGRAYKDYEPEYAYLLTTPEMMASLRSANLIDTDRVRDGNVDFNTIFQGKFRLIQTRASASLTTAEIDKINASTGTAVPIGGTKVSYIILPGSLAMKSLAIDEPTEIDRNAAAYMGGGTTQMWYRWGYVIAPAGYDWNGSEGEFPSDVKYTYVKDSADNNAIKALSGATNVITATGTWVRKVNSALSLGILPVFHT